MSSKRGNIFVTTLVASAIIGFLSVLSLTPVTTEPIVSISVTPNTIVGSVGNTITATVRVRADRAVNAYTGIVRFDPAVITVTDISYNTAVADLWAEAPWYQNGDGTIHFAGGTTQPGGFTGEDTLLTITFLAENPGKARIVLTDAAVLLHDGFGTAADLAPMLDSLVTIGTPLTPTSEPQTDVIVRTATYVTDLSGDRKTTLVDVSIFMLYLASGDLRGDINRDGRVNTLDLSIMLTPPGQ